MKREQYRRNLLRLVSVAFVAGLLAACQNTSNTTPIPLNAASNPLLNANGFESAFLAPGGNYSLVTVRKRPEVLVSGQIGDVLCTAPSADWATALALQQQLSGSGGITAKASGSLTASNSSSETISLLAGRTAASWHYVTVYIKRAKPMPTAS
jgi:hypothetical protein